MRIAVFSTKPYDRQYLEAANAVFNHDISFFESRLLPETMSLAQGFEGVCVFVNDVVDAEVIDSLAASGVRVIALRCAGFNNVDLVAAKARGLVVVRVPAYSPYAVAEHALALMLALNRHVHKAYQRVREGNFSLQGLLGFDMHGKTVCIVGTGRIGSVLAGILKGMGLTLLGCDPQENPDCIALGMEYGKLEDMLPRADIVSLHCPLTPQTHHLINEESIAKMKPGVMLVNTGRGAIVETTALIDALKTGQIGYLGLDVYEQEADLFFEDLSDQVIQDDVFERLLTFPNVLITGHQGFFTHEALTHIAETTLANLRCLESGEACEHAVSADTRLQRVSDNRRKKPAT